MKICVVGNCQAKQLSLMLEHSQPRFEVISVPENYLANEMHREVYDKAYANSDFIFVQNVNLNFEPEFCRQDYAKQFGKPVVVWPVLYFDGYFPDIGYFRANNEIVVSLLGGYHSRYVRHLYLAGTSLDDAYSLYTGKNFAETFVNSFTLSIASLAERERNCDIKISDYINTHCRERQMFFVTNHPDNETLRVLLSRILSHIDLNISVNNPLRELDQAIFPINRFILEQENARFTAPQEFRLKNESGEGLAPVSVFSYVQALYETYGSIPRAVLQQGVAL